MNKEKLLEIISQEIGVSIDDIMGKSRKHKIIIGRHLAFIFLHDTCNMSNLEIAKMFDFYPTSVVQIRRGYKNLLKVGDKEYTYYFNKVQRRIK